MCVCVCVDACVRGWPLGKRNSGDRFLQPLEGGDKQRVQLQLFGNAHALNFKQSLALLPPVHHASEAAGLSAVRSPSTYTPTD